MGLGAEAYARMMAALLPPGRLWRLVDGVLSKLLLACADELARLDARVDDLLDEADPRTASELIPEYERELGLEPTAGGDVAATLDASTIGIETSGADWRAILTATEAGAAGNAIVFDILIAEGFPDAIEVRDDEVYLDPGGWTAAAGTIGVLAGAGGGPIVWTVADLEAAINATSLLVQVTSPDGDPSKELLEQIEKAGTFSGGVDAVSESRARIVGRLVARQRYRPVDIQAALAALLGQAADDVVVLERSHAYASGVLGDDREIFRFFIYRDPAAPGDYYLESAQDLVNAMKPSHTAGHVIESTNFLCDDPYSLCDRDVLGA